MVDGVNSLNKQNEELLKRYYETEDFEAYQNILLLNDRLNYHIAKKFLNSGEDIEDLASISRIGMIKAIKSFDPNKEIKFATYATRCMTNEILMSFRREKKHKNNVSLEQPLYYDGEGNELKLENQRKWREENKEYERQRHKEWREENREYDLKRRKDYRKRLKKKYNIPDRWGGKGQALVRGYAEEVLGAKAQEEVTFDWLISDKGYPMPVDIYFPEHNLIIEYNGQQHYFPVDFGSGMKEAKENFKEQKSRDLLKYGLILEHGFNLLVIPYSFSKKSIVKLVSQYKKGDDANG